LSRFGPRGRLEASSTPWGRGDGVRERRATQVASLNIPVTTAFNLESFLSSDAVIQDWTAKGLPADEHSVQNGILTTAASRFPLCIDPQQQAVSWIKNMYGKDQLKIKSLSESDFMKHLELAIQFGAPFLFENVDEELDPMLDPVRPRRPVDVTRIMVWVVSFPSLGPFGPRRGIESRFGPNRLIEGPETTHVHHSWTRVTPTKWRRRNTSKRRDLTRVPRRSG